MSSLSVILVIPAAILLVAAVLLLVLFLLGNVMQVDVHFESSDGKWADTERTFKGYAYPTLARAFDRYKATVKEPVALLRTTPMDWSRVSLWPTYLINPKWRVPYARRTVASAQLFPASGKGEVHDLLAVSEYLDQCAKSHRPATLVGMLAFVDYHQRVIPTLDEINKALEQRGEKAVTSDDVDSAYQEYRRAFKARTAKS